MIMWYNLPMAKIKLTKQKKAWVVAVNMGYGHQRTAYPLKNFAAEDRIINANNYEGIPTADKKLWESTRIFYELISNFKRFPVLGDIAFEFFIDKFQKISIFYPKKDLSKPTFQLKKVEGMIGSGWGRDLIERLKKNPLPIISTFFTSAFMAEHFKYPGEIYCVVCDADVSRAWVRADPKKSRIKYLVPNDWVIERLKLYGVEEKNIFLTGYPLPLENIGGQKLNILKKDFSHRLLNLDPEGHYYKQYRTLIKKYVGNLPRTKSHILTIMFSIGGAGAQKDIAVKLVKSLAEKIKKEEVKIILMAGVKYKVRQFFFSKLKSLKLAGYIGKNIEVVFSDGVEEYFKKFNQKLRETDILWTKPSELSFYTALGIPIIIAPPVGSQEDFNKRWLLRLGAGIAQENADYADQWIFDYLKSGRFAEAAMQGFIEAEKLGTYNIKKICLG
mgnify:CR=1 FL=1